MPSAGKAKHNRRSRSRNTTPSVSTIASADAPQSEQNHYSKLIGVTSQRHTSLSDTLTHNGSNSPSNIPSAAHLNRVRVGLKDVLIPNLNKTEDGLEQGLREIVKNRPELVRQQAEKDADHRKKAKAGKKRDKERERDDERPLAIGAHGVARQDGHKEDSSSISSIASPNEGPGKDEKAEASSDDESRDDHQPTAAPKVSHFQTFGPDPSTFPDPTIYHIRDLTDDITEEEKKEILCVAEYPHDDLHDLTAGTPPDKDFSNAKPTNQISASVFANYVEPYIRPLVDEDMAFLRERGDRANPFLTPARGSRHYKETWAEEDGAMALDSNAEKLPQNEARGSIEQMNDDLAETDQISTGPVLARLLSAMRAENRINDNNEGNTNGDSMDVDGENQQNGDHPTTNGAEPHSPSTHMPESNQSGWKNQATTTAPKLDYSAIDERLLGELRHIGFVGEDQYPEFDKQADDEVSARLRYLQSELRRQSVMNGARRARVLELAEERLAMQEYSTIADDLDGQINQAYLKRNRNLGKGKKGAKRPGAGPGVAVPSGVGKPGVGQPVRELLERKHQWATLIGPVVNAGRASIPTSTIFDPDVMKRLEAKETETWGLEEE